MNSPTGSARAAPSPSGPSRYARRPKTYRSTSGPTPTPSPGSAAVIMGRLTARPHRPQLLHDMLLVHEGMRQQPTAQQQKATHAVQLRTILQKLTMRGLLAPESAAYISSLPPQTPMGNGRSATCRASEECPGRTAGDANMDLLRTRLLGSAPGQPRRRQPVQRATSAARRARGGLTREPVGPGRPDAERCRRGECRREQLVGWCAECGRMGENRQQTSTRLSSIDSTAAAFLQEDFADPVAFGVHVDNRQPQPYPVGASSSTHGGSHSGASSSKDVTNDLVKLGWTARHLASRLRRVEQHCADAGFAAASRRLPSLRRRRTRRRRLRRTAAARWRRHESCCERPLAAATAT